MSGPLSQPVPGKPQGSGYGNSSAPVPYDQPGQVESWRERQHARNGGVPPWQPLSGDDNSEPETSNHVFLGRVESGSWLGSAIGFGILIGFIILTIVLSDWAFRPLGLP